MDKIISFRRYICGYEDFDFSELYRGCTIKNKKLPVNVFVTEHKKHGLMLINTGCSKLLKINATAFSRLLTKHRLRFRDEDSVKNRLEEDGLDPIAVKKVLLTHCSPECCGGLNLLPKYELISIAKVLTILWLADTSDGLMKSTLPTEDTPTRAAGIFKGKSFISDYFRWVFDIFGDGTILAVDITGHDKAMAGFFLTEKNIFIAADASIDETALTEGLIPTDKLLKQQAYPDDYLSVLATLRRLKKEHPEIRILFSHSENVPTI